MRKRRDEGVDGEKRRKRASVVASEISFFAERVMVMEKKKKKMEFAKL